MTIEEQKVVGNAPESAVSNPTQEKVVSEVADQDNKPVDFRSFNKVLGQLKKQKELNDELSGRLTSFESEKKAVEESKLAEQGEYKKLLDMRNADIDTLKKKLEEATGEAQAVRTTLSDAQKLQAVYDKLPGRLTNPKYAQWIDLDSVAFNPDTNEIDIQSVDLVVNSFMEEHGRLVDTSHIGKLPGHAPGHASQPIHKRFKDLPLKDMRKNMADAVRQAKKEQGVS